MLDPLNPLTVTPATVEDRPTHGRKKKKRKKTENERYRLDSESTHMIALVSCQASTLLDIGMDIPV